MLLCDMFLVGGTIITSLYGLFYFSIRTASFNIVTNTPCSWAKQMPQNRHTKKHHFRLSEKNGASERAESICEP